MSQFDRPFFKSTTAAAALLLPLLPLAVSAQSTGFAIEVGPSTDFYVPVRVGVRVFGPVADPAASYVRGCPGAVLPETAGAHFQITDPMESLSFTGAGDGVLGMVLGTPDGLFHCVLADERGFVVTQMTDVEPGRHSIWLTAAQGTSLDARLLASDHAISAMEVFGLDVAGLGAPRVGQFVFSASAESGRQELAIGAPLYAETEMRALSSDYCPGYSRFDAADAVLTLDQASDRFSIFAMSNRDLTMAVVGPDGTVLCNDDAFQLNPAVSFDNAQAGEYQVFVGAYSQGDEGVYDLFASAGAPAFSDSVLDLSAAPRAGSGVFDIDQAGQGQFLANARVAANDPMEMLPIGSYCPGFTDVSAPDYVMTLDAAQPMISLYARSQADLVMAVRAPDGSWSCNDDSFELNPAVTYENAQAGDYLIFVGAYNPGASNDYMLYTSMGSPSWDMTESEDVVAPARLNPNAEPVLGRIEFGPETRLDPRFIFDIQPSQSEAFGMGRGCAGFITPSQPDLVISAQPGLPQLMVYMASEADGTLVVSGPDGTLYCNDDFEQLNPGVMIPNAPAGDYAVFAGTYSGNGGVATLGVTIAAPQWVMDREH